MEEEMKKNFLITAEMLDKYGLCGAFVHDELLQRYLLVKDWFSVTPQELSMVLPFEAKTISRNIDLLELDGLLKTKTENKRKFFKVKELYEVKE